MISKDQAQAIIELTLLGSVVLFVLSVLLRYGLTFSETPTAQYKAFRHALKQSISDAYNPEAGGNSKIARLNASLILIEDRSTAQGGEKYGSSTRSPQTTSGSGMLSTQMIRPFDFGEYHNLPVMDMIINGDHFVFRTAGITQYCQAVDSVTCECDPLIVGEYGKPEYPSLIPMSANTTNNVCDQHIVIQPPAIMPRAKHLNWVPHPFKNEFVLTSNFHHQIFYAQITRDHIKFCDEINNTGGSPPGHHCQALPGQHDSLENRFNLRGDPWFSLPSLNVREKLSWQWIPIVSSNIGLDYWGEEGFADVDINHDYKTEGVMAFATVPLVMTQYEPQECKFIPQFSPAPCSLPNPDLDDHGYSGNHKPMPLAFLSVLNNQMGDLDLTFNLMDKEMRGLEAPGLVSGEERIQTLVLPELGAGSFIVDQKSQNNTRETVSARQRTSVDIVERKVRLSNNTGCFCPAYDPLAPIENGGKECLEDAGGPWDTDNGRRSYCKDDNLTVKVACEGEGCCSEGDEFTRFSTCFEYDRKGTPIIYDDHFMLYVRTTLLDRQGYRLKTQETIKTINF